MGEGGVAENSERRFFIGSRFSDGGRRSAAVTAGGTAGWGARQQRRGAGGGRQQGEDQRQRGYASAASTALKARSDSNGGSGGQPSSTRVTGDSWRRVGDVPSLVVGVGFLVARHRREFRAKKERKFVAGTRTEEEEEAMVQAGVAAAGLGSAGSRRAVQSARDGRRKVAESYASGGGDGDDMEGGEGEMGEKEEGEEGEMYEEESTGVDGISDERQRRYREDEVRRNGEGGGGGTGGGGYAPVVCDCLA